MISHSDARLAVSEAFKRLDPPCHPFLAAMQWAQSVGIIESGYGNGKATNNWGSVQCNHAPPAVDGECIILTDHKVDGSAFEWPYRVYQSPEDGAFGMLSLIWRKWPKALELADQGDTLGASEALYGYYTGVKPKSGEGSNLSGKALQKYLALVHARGVFKAAKSVAAALDEKLQLKDPDSKLSRTGGGTSIWLMAGIGAALVLLGSRK